jgi:hypothetical protein
VLSPTLVPFYVKLGFISDSKEPQLQLDKSCWSDITYVTNAFF